MQQLTGIEYLKVDIANAFGHDKLLWDERIAWTDAQNMKFDLNQAEEKFMAAKAIQAYEDALNEIPTGHVIYMDATASGLQIMACLMGCITTAKNVNLIFTGKREDGYTNATTAMNQYMSVEILREVMKPPTMTVFYGSKAEPKNVFGEDTEELKAFYKALLDCFPGALEYLADTQGSWQGDAYYHQWTLPNGCVSRVKVWEDVEKKIEINELGCTFTHRGRVNRPTDTGITLAANIVQSIDAWIDAEMVLRAKKQGFELLSIFDAFGCSPNHMNKVRQNYLDIMIELASMDLLGDILSEITGKDLSVEKLSYDLPKLMESAEYALS